MHYNTLPLQYNNLTLHYNTLEYTTITIQYITLTLTIELPCLYTLADWLAYNKNRDFTEIKKKLYFYTSQLNTYMHVLHKNL